MAHNSGTSFFKQCFCLMAIGCLAPYPVSSSDCNPGNSSNQVAEFPGPGFFGESHVTLPNMTLDSNWSAALWLFADKSVPADLADILNFGNVGQAGQRWYLIRRARGKLTIQMSSNGTRNATLTFHQVPTDEWLHFTIVQSVALVTVYLNGSNPLSHRDNETLTSDGEETFAPCLLGAASHEDSTWKGQMDNVKIWNRALAHGEAVHAMKTTGPSSGLLGFWRFDRGPGNIAEDFSGNGQNATLQSAVKRGVDGDCRLNPQPYGCSAGRGGVSCDRCGRGTWSPGGSFEDCADCSDGVGLEANEEFENKTGLTSQVDCNAVCKSGFKTDNFNNCQDVNECETGDDYCDRNGGWCINFAGGFTCSCNDGYSSELDRDNRNHACRDVNECTGRPFVHYTCPPSSTCNNTFGSYECVCNTGFEADGNTCSDIDECQTGVHSCHENNFCLNSLGGSFQCFCLVGFETVEDECIDVDECENGRFGQKGHRCNINARCNNTQGAYECICNSGYAQEGAGMQNDCGDTNECLENSTHTCEANENCVNTDGSFECACKSGFRRNASNLVEPGGCININECILNASTPPCSPEGATCRDTEGSFSCECNSGYEGNGIQCFTCENPRDNPCQVRMTFVATLGMSEFDFYTIRDEYVGHVARAADVNPAVVTIGVVNRVFVRRRLHATAVEVETSLTTPSSRSAELTANIADSLQRELERTDGSIPLLSVSEPYLEDVTPPYVPPEDEGDSLIEPEAGTPWGMVAWGAAAGACVLALSVFCVYMRGQAVAEREKLEDWGL